MALGDLDQAFAEVESARRDRWGDLVWTKAGPEYDPLRSDSRFAALLKEMRFPQ
jgi:hypothetical protein